MSRLIALALGGAGLAGLLLEAGAAFLPPEIPSSSAFDVAAPSAASAPPDLRLGGLELYAVVVARPLFLAERAPQPPLVAPVSRGGGGIVFGLTGTLTSGARRFALLRRPDGQIDRLTEGQSVEGWQIIAIQSDRVTLESAQGTIEVRFTAPSGGGLVLPPRR